MTRSGIEHDLEKSPYKYEAHYENNNTITFYFASNTALNNFILKRQVNYIDTQGGLSARFKLDFFMGMDVCDLQLYRKLERRGFLITLNGVDLKWPEAIAYDGTKLLISALGAQLMRITKE